MAGEAFLRLARSRDSITLVPLPQWIGMALEGFGFINLFGNFFGVAIQAMRHMPVTC